MDYHQALGIVKAAMKAGARVTVLYDGVDLEFAVELDGPEEPILTREFLLAVKLLPDGLRVC